MAGYRDVVAETSDDLSRSKPRTPKGYETPEKFLKELQKNYSCGIEFERHNIQAGKDDAKFTYGNQWDERIRQRREALGKPVITVPRMMAFVAQVVGNRLMNETEIRVYPEKAGTKEVAQIREGLIRSIFKNSHADFARDEAAKYQAIGGVGYFTLDVRYTSDDVFEQEIFINAVSDPYSVVMDPLSIEPSGEDAQWGIVTDDIPQSEYKNRWPWAAEQTFDRPETWNDGGHWMREDTIRIATYWKMVTEGYRYLALYQDGTTHDVTEKDEFEYLPFVAARSDGSPYIRKVPNRFARGYVCSGAAVLEGPFDLPISSIPIYRVPGWEVNDGEKIHRWGIVRQLKDSQRLHNYFRSVIAEQLISGPRNKWLTTPEAVKGHEQKWRKAPTSDDPFLYYNDDASAPTPVAPPQMDAALLNEAATTTQDMKDISNIHEAALGMPSNEVSRVAIQQRQMVSDVGTYIYIDRRRLADQRCARNINELIPYIYDTQRVVTIIGSDDKILMQVINNPTDPNSDVTIGKYGVKVSVGPATETKRALAAEQMMAFVNAMPQAAMPVMPLIAEAQDWPKAGEIARVLKTIAASEYPGLIPEDEMTPEMQAAQQQQAQMAQLQAQLAQAEQEAKIAGLSAKASNDEARARLAEAQAYKAVMDARSRMMDVEGKNDERELRADAQEFDQTMRALDQHNSLVGEDRDFDDRLEERNTRMKENSRGNQ